MTDITNRIQDPKVVPSIPSPLRPGTTPKMLASRVLHAMQHNEDVASACAISDTPHTTAISMCYPWLEQGSQMWTEVMQEVLPK